MFKKTKFVLMIVVTFVVCLNIHPAFCRKFSDRTNEINKHIESLTSSPLTRKIDTAKIITRSGYTDIKLFDVIEKELLENYLSASGSDNIDYMSWLCKALASSGLDQYKATLEKISQTTKSHKLKQYAIQSLGLFKEYAQRAAVISSGQNAKAGRDPEIVRLMNMLQSNLMNVKRDAAKLITRNDYSDPDLFKLLNKELLAGYNSSNDMAAIDTMAWLCKALANSQEPAYKETLQKIIDTSKHGKLVKYAKKSLRMMK